MPDGANIARVYDYLLGGKDNYDADRQLGERIKASMPGVHLGVQQQRAALGRVVRFLVGEAGLRQIVDVGSGLPTAGNVHEVAHETAPDTRVVYVDNDPLVLSHARALMADDRTTIAIEGDARRPAEILKDPELLRLIDLGRPVGLLLCGILHHLLDDEDPAGIVRAFHDALAPGSYVFIHHLVATGDPSVAVSEAELRQATGRGQFRTAGEIRRFFDGWELVDPGLVTVVQWRPEPETPAVDDHPVLRLAVAGVARKPSAARETAAARKTDAARKPGVASKPGAARKP